MHTKKFKIGFILLSSCLAVSALAMESTSLIGRAAFAQDNLYYLECTSEKNNMDDAIRNGGLITNAGTLISAIADNAYYEEGYLMGLNEGGYFENIDPLHSIQGIYIEFEGDLKMDMKFEIAEENHRLNLPITSGETFIFGFEKADFLRLHTDEGCLIKTFIVAYTCETITEEYLIELLYHYVNAFLIGEGSFVGEKEEPWEGNSNYVDQTFVINQYNTDLSFVEHVLTINLKAGDVFKITQANEEFGFSTFNNSYGAIANGEIVQSENDTLVVMKDGSYTLHFAARNTPTAHWIDPAQPIV